MHLLDDINKLKKYISKFQTKLDSAESFINSGDVKSANDELLDAEIISENIVNLSRLTPVALGIPNSQEKVEQSIINSNDIKIKYFNNNTCFYVKIPSLLPKKEKGNPIFIRSSLQTALSDFFSKNNNIKLTNKSTIVFKHNYSADRKEREYRDHDNIELNVVVDLLTLHVLVDDMPLLLRHYYLSSLSDTDSTEIFIIPNDKFPSFLSELRKLEVANGQAI